MIRLEARLCFLLHRIAVAFIAPDIALHALSYSVYRQFLNSSYFIDLPEYATFSFMLYLILVMFAFLETSP